MKPITLRANLDKCMDFYLDHNMIGMDSTFEELLITAATSIGLKSSNRTEISTFNNPAQLREVAHFLNKRIQPTPCDRRKMEKISQK